MNITLPSLTALTAIGNSSVDIQSGKTDEFETVIMGAANVHGFGFTAKQAHITIEGSGNTEVSVTEKLHAKITGSGNIYYKGNAAASSNITGSGKVIKQ